MTKLKILSCGPGTSIQDRGRRGWLRFGIASSGAADMLALSAANMLVGNSANCEAIELVLMGGAFEVTDGAARMALAGARMPIRVDGAAIPDHTSFVLKPGQRLEIDFAPEGVYAVLAVQGGFDIPIVLGSKSWHRRAGIGGLNGKPLGAGSLVPLLLQQPGSSDQLALKPIPLTSDEPLRVVLGPQQSFITAGGIATFLEEPFVISHEVDRMACRLAGPKIELASGFNIVSDGIVSGSVQVPGSGHPIVMLADRQTVGGYPKIATIVSADLRRLVQARPGQTVRFTAVTIEEAEASARFNATAISALPQQIRRKALPLDHGNLLPDINLAGHASNASDPLSWQF